MRIKSFRPANLAAMSLLPLFAGGCENPILQNFCALPGFDICELINIEDGAFRLSIPELLDFGVVTLLEKQGLPGFAVFGFSESDGVFELKSGSAFVTSKRAEPEDLEPIFQTEHVVLGTEGTSYFVEIDPVDESVVEWTVFEGSVVLARRDESPWLDGSAEFRIIAGQTFVTFGNKLPQRLPDKTNEERNEILSAVMSTAASDDLQNVPYVDGMTAAEAIAVMEEFGLVASTTLSDSDIVTSTVPAGGNAVELGSTVQLVGG